MKYLHVKNCIERLDAQYQGLGKLYKHGSIATILDTLSPDAATIVGLPTPMAGNIIRRKADDMLTSSDPVLRELGVVLCAFATDTVAISVFQILLDFASSSRAHVYLPKSRIDQIMDTDLGAVESTYIQYPFAPMLVTLSDGNIWYHAGTDEHKLDALYYWKPSQLPDGTMLRVVAAISYETLGSFITSVPMIAKPQTPAKLTAQENCQDVVRRVDDVLGQSGSLRNALTAMREAYDRQSSEDLAMMGMPKELLGTTGLRTDIEGFDVAADFIRELAMKIVMVLNHIGHTTNYLQLREQCAVELKHAQRKGILSLASPYIRLPRVEYSSGVQRHTPQTCKERRRHKSSWWVVGHIHHYWHGTKGSQTLQEHWVEPYLVGKVPTHAKLYVVEG